MLKGPLISPIVLFEVEEEMSEESEPLVLKIRPRKSRRRTLDLSLVADIYPKEKNEHNKAGMEKSEKTRWFIVQTGEELDENILWCKMCVRFSATTTVSYQSIRIEAKGFEWNWFSKRKVCEREIRTDFKYFSSI